MPYLSEKVHFQQGQGIYTLRTHLKHAVLASIADKQRMEIMAAHVLVKCFMTELRSLSKGDKFKRKLNISLDDLVRSYVKRK